MIRIARISAALAAMLAGACSHTAEEKSSADAAAPSGADGLFGETGTPLEEAAPARQVWRVQGIPLDPIRKTPTAPPQEPFAWDDTLPPDHPPLLTDPPDGELPSQELPADPTAPPLDPAAPAPSPADGSAPTDPTVDPTVPPSAEPPATLSDPAQGVPTAPENPVPADPPPAAAEQDSPAAPGN